MFVTLERGCDTPLGHPRRLSGGDPLELSNDHEADGACTDHDGQRRLQNARRRVPTARVGNSPGATSAMSASTACGLGFTRARPPMTTVGTVSLPLAAERTTAAASGSSQMLWNRIGTLRRFSDRFNMEQNGHPGRQ